ncbi:MAG: hypothetical protein KME16_25555 [Scytolyngbya sp. HA4215-MV1]|jgi:hypothetical protein|nr:hypothetical protein [Scytolyngbya sp. HA4215-MV1]
MRHPFNQSSGLELFLWLSLWGLPATAHTVKAAEDVAVTFHIEPHHNPRSGQPAQAWFLLTQVGGAQIPFQQCNCQLTVYPQSAPHTPLPVLTLKPIAAEQYQEIPGAEIVFPKPGIYTLELSGKPRSSEEATFKPFKLSYDVTVVAGTVSSPAATLPTVSAPARSPAQPSQPVAAATQPVATTVSSVEFPILPLAGIALLAGMAGFIWWAKTKQ